MSSQVALLCQGHLTRSFDEQEIPAHVAQGRFRAADIERLPELSTQAGDCPRTHGAWNGNLIPVLAPYDDHAYGNGLPCGDHFRVGEARSDGHFAV